MSTAGQQLKYGAHSIGVRAAVTDLKWLQEFFYPSFEFTPSCESSIEVSVRTNQDEYRDIENVCRSGACPMLDCFTLDGSFAAHPALVGDGRLKIHDGRYRVGYDISNSGQKITVVRGAKSDRHRLALMRIIRELTTSAALAEGHIPIHGAAVYIDGQATLISGPKQAGKTSLLVHALLCHGAFLANDRVFLSLDADAVSARGMPTIVKIRPGTLEFFPELRERFQQCTFHREKTLRECAVATREFSSPNLTATQFCQLLNAPAIARAAVKQIVFPHINADLGGVRWNRLPSKHAATKLRRSLLRPSSPMRVSSVFSASEHRTVDYETQLQHQCREVSERVPCFDLQMGPNAYRRGILSSLRRAA